MTRSIDELARELFAPLLAERRSKWRVESLEVLAGAGFTAAVLTRAGRVTDDLEVFKRFEKSGVGFSIPTDDDRIRQIFEPGADPIEERLEALELARAAGLATVAFIQPDSGWTTWTT